MKQAGEKHYVETRIDLSSAFMDVLGELIEVALLNFPKVLENADTEVDQKTALIHWMLVQAIKRNKDCDKLGKESDLNRIVYDVNYTDEGERAPELISYWHRPKTEKDEEDRKAQRAQDLATIQRLARQQGWAITVFNTPEVYGRFGTIQHTSVSGPPTQTGTYVLWVALTKNEKEFPISMYYDATSNQWYDNDGSDAVRSTVDVPKFTAYLGPIPVRFGE